MPSRHRRRICRAALSAVLCATSAAGCYDLDIFGPDTPTTRAHVHGVVTSAANGSPVAGARVYPYRTGWTVYSGSGIAIDTAVTDADGRYVLDSEHYCPAYVGVRAEEYMLELTGFSLGCQGTQDAELDIELAPAEWGVADYEPAWSPAGAEIAYSSWRPADGFGTFDLYVADTLGGAQAITDGVGAGAPSWSPDGRWLAVTGGASGLYLVDRDGAGLHEVDVGVQIGGVAWSPAGTTLAYWTIGGSVEAHIFVLDTLTSTVTRLTEPGSSNRNASWSPDGSQVVFERWTEGVASQIYRMDADGTGRRRLTDLMAGARDPAWSPCGERVAFTSPVLGKSAIHVMDADGGNVRVLTDAAGDDSGPTWGPDCERIAFSSDRGARVQGAREIWMVQADGSSLRRVTHRE